MINRPKCMHWDDHGDETAVGCTKPATHVIVHRNPEATVQLVEGTDHFAGRDITPETEARYPLVFALYMCDEHKEPEIFRKPYTVARLEGAVE